MKPTALIFILFINCSLALAQTTIPHPVKYQNSTVFAQTLHDHGVVADVYLYEKGGHGYGMNNKSSTVKWMDLVEEWLKKMKFD
ncbi:MAG TPA: hypothetical protein VGI43_00075 [Mucilaginibacter sp.]|jgi:acetyl esterase/lipase